MTPEGIIASYLKKKVTEAGGTFRKVSWEGRNNAPDYLVLLENIHFFVETKAPGERARPSQEREFERLKAAGFQVFVVSTKQEVDDVLKQFQQ